ncbi:hypothetical protein [Pseudarthrobacter oxydans]|uniref:hypothetical protein n=1 Tax=Pseudarthrobacter oxydans TaxID=1671 RepID=UPI002AA662A1|nr:hypothetical protein [Pseudarthrobacter oxydans]WPU08950.1 hypothetical protein SMD14_17680 [Pseudarthrobacter oxydans]
MPRKPQKLKWVPVHTTHQDGRKVTLAGKARTRLSDKFIARKYVDVKDLQGKPIGKFDSITNDSGALTVVFVLNEGTAKPGGKFLLGLKHEGIHVAYALSAAELRPGDELPRPDKSPRAYVGMLGEES